jgi:hypothetical protein
MDIEFFNQLLRELVPYLPTLESARAYAENQYNALPDNIKAQARPRSQSSLMNDFIVVGLRKNILSFPEVIPFDRYGQTIISIKLSNCTVNIKCKKINKRRQISFIPTQMAIEFMDNQSYQLSYLDPVINLFFGFQWNNIRTKVEKIYILHPYGPNHFDWECEIAKPYEAISPLLPPVGPTDDRLPEKRVKPKKPKNKKRYSKKNKEKRKENEL